MNSAHDAGTFHTVLFHACIKSNFECREGSQPIRLVWCFARDET